MTTLRPITALAVPALAALLVLSSCEANSAPSQSGDFNVDAIAEKSMCCLLQPVAGFDAGDDSIAGCSAGLYWLYFSNYPPQCCNNTGDCINAGNGWTCEFGIYGVPDPPSPNPPSPGGPPPVSDVPSSYGDFGKCCPPLLPAASATSYPGCPTT
jgi:hypothetical protein